MPAPPTSQARSGWRASIAVAVLGVATAGCGIAGGTPSLGPTTTSAAVSGHLQIQPAEGPVGTLFTLSADGMPAGVAVQFEITFPNANHAYPGNALVVGDDGTATITYKATAANVPGPYQVRLTGPQGQLATGQFTVTDGKPLVPTSSTAKGGGSSTTARSGTAKSTTSTAKTGTTGTSSTKPATSTTKPVATTVEPPTSATTTATTVKPSGP